MGVHQSEIGLKSIKGQDWSGKEVLDVGCGSGKLTYEVLRVTNAKKITGVDIEPSKIEKAKKLAREKGESRLGFRVTSASDLQIFQDNSFDIIFSNIAFQQFANKPAAIGEMCWVLRKTGQIFINFIEEKSEVRKEMDELVSKLVEIKKGSKITREEFEEMARQAGLEIISSRSVTHTHFYESVEKMLEDYQKFEVVFPALKELPKEQLEFLEDQLKKHFLVKKTEKGVGETWKVVLGQLGKY